MTQIPTNSPRDAEEWPTLMYEEGFASGPLNADNFSVGAFHSPKEPSFGSPLQYQNELESPKQPSFGSPLQYQNEIESPVEAGRRSSRRGTRTASLEATSAPAPIPVADSPAPSLVGLENPAVVIRPFGQATATEQPVTTYNHRPAPFAISPGLQSPDDQPFARKPVYCNPQEIPTSLVWGMHFARLNMQQAVAWIEKMILSGKTHHVITANLNYAMLNETAKGVATVTRRASMVLADGWPIVSRSKLTTKPLPCRVAGSDLIYELAELSHNKGYRIYFLGGKEGVADKAVDNLREQFPKIQVAGIYAPPFRKLKESEEAEMVANIRNAQADILLVAFGQPKGELWIARNQEDLQVPVSIQLGASFDFVAGLVERAPEIYQKTGMEWFFRMRRDPQRLVPRYLGNAFFLARKLADDIWNVFTQR